MTTYEEKVALWHRLRNDPDYDPSWAGFMGHSPPKPPVERYRTWGDGASDNRKHVIADISFAEHWVVCRCGARIEGANTASIEDLWDLHRGLSMDWVVARRLDADQIELATGTEVRDFLGRAADPTYSYKVDE